MRIIYKKIKFMGEVMGAEYYLCLFLYIILIIVIICKIS